MYNANSINVKFKKGDYVKVVEPYSMFRGLVFRVNRRRYDKYYLELIPNVSYSKLNGSRERFTRTLHYHYFYKESLQPYNQNRLDGDKL